MKSLRVWLVSVTVVLASVLALACLQVPTAYTAVEIPCLPEKDTIGTVFLTESGMAAGYWYQHVPPGHMGAVLAAPFVWTGGKLVPLPLGDAKYGHVRGGGDRMLVGDVDSDEGWIPAMWAPDPQSGWRDATLKVLSKKPGVARCVAKDGTIWGDTMDGIWSWTARGFKESRIGRYEVIGLDERGTIYLNRVEPGGFAGSTNEYAFRVVGGKFESLKPPEARDSSLTAVNVEGTAIGTVFAKGWTGGVWRDGSFEDLPVDEGRTAIPRAINGKGVVVGQLANPSTSPVMTAVLWKEGRRVDLSAVLVGKLLTDARAINDKGQILAVAEDKLFLLTPKAPTNANDR